MDNFWGGRKKRGGMTEVVGEERGKEGAEANAKYL